MLETNLIDSDVAIFEPVAGSSGARMLSTGLVAIENNMDKKNLDPQ